MTRGHLQPTLRQQYSGDPMLRVLTSLIRNAPGPFRGARALTADFIDGLVDVVSPPVDAEQPVPPPGVRADEEGYTSQIKDREERSSSRESGKAAGDGDAKEAKSPAAAADSGSPKGDLEAALKKSIGRKDWVRRQDFKVLAIFWEADRRGLEALTAKKASKLGSEIGVTIRHENIRKVIRTRLTEKIETTTVPDSQPPTFQYEMTSIGKTFFEKEYLSNV